MISTPADVQQDTVWWCLWIQLCSDFGSTGPENWIKKKQNKTKDQLFKSVFLNISGQNKSSQQQTKLKNVHELPFRVLIYLVCVWLSSGFI